jgi:hypothetical protein
MDISDLHLVQGPSSNWLSSLPCPCCDFRPATKLGELRALAPAMWAIWGRRCLFDVVVYGNGKNSLAIRLEAGRWRLHGYEGVEGKDLLSREMVEAALAAWQP